MAFQNKRFYLKCANAKFWVGVCVTLLSVSTVQSIAASSGPQQAALLSAFFGLDNALPFRANMLCLGASGKDGMPIVLSHIVDSETLQAEDFQVITQSGEKRTPHCVTLRPAQDPGELRTVLLIGEFGNAGDDPPVKVHVVDDLFADAASLNDGRKINFKGAHVAVVPLDAGPAMVLAEDVPLNKLESDTRGTQCPQSVKQVVRITWAGGVRLPNGGEPGEAQRKLYTVTVRNPDGATDETIPAALADLGDGDNNHLLCLETDEPVISVHFPAGQMVDPNQDLNPDTRITVIRHNQSGAH